MSLFETQNGRPLIPMKVNKIPTCACVSFNSQSWVWPSAGGMLRISWMRAKDSEYHRCAFFLSLLFSMLLASCGLLGWMFMHVLVFFVFGTGQIVFATSHLGGARSGQSWRHCTGIIGSSIIKTQPTIYHVALLYHGMTSSISLPCLTISSSLYPQITS